jgi:hypothetical protein
MKKVLTVVGVSLLVSVAGVLWMHIFAIKPFSKTTDECCDQFILEASYGFPLPFKKVYSGGLSGKGETTTKPANIAVDGAILFVVTAVILSVVPAVRKRPA